MPRLVVLPVDGLPLGKRWLNLGDQGKDVRQLQELLTALGLYEAEITGEYDLLTREGVKAFQRAYRLPVDGVIGPDTCKLLAEGKIHNRILKKTVAEESLSTLATLYGVGPQAFKDPETRRRLRQVETGRLVMLERRELVFGLKTPGSTGSEAQTGAESCLHYVKLGELKALTKQPIRPAESLVVDLTEENLTSSKRRLLRRLRSKLQAELIWWLSADHHRFPAPGEADALIISLPFPVAEQSTHAYWQREVKRILKYYPCTRLFVHFDLREKERAETGEERFLTPVESRMARLNRIGSLKRLGEYGWIFYRYRVQDETRAVLRPDTLTVRGILNYIDRLNLRGVVLTGLEVWPEAWQREGNRYFLATPRILVMKDGEFA